MWYASNALLFSIGKLEIILIPIHHFLIFYLSCAGEQKISALFQFRILSCVQQGARGYRKNWSPWIRCIQWNCRREVALAQILQTVWTTSSPPCSEFSCYSSCGGRNQEEIIILIDPWHMERFRISLIILVDPWYVERFPSSSCQWSILDTWNDCPDQLDRSVIHGTIFVIPGFIVDPKQKGKKGMGGIKVDLQFCRTTRTCIRSYNVTSSSPSQVELQFLQNHKDLYLELHRVRLLVVVTWHVHILYPNIKSRPNFQNSIRFLSTPALTSSFNAISPLHSPTVGIPAVIW